MFPIYDSDARLAGLTGRCPNDRGVRWLKQQTSGIPFSPGAGFTGLKRRRHISGSTETILVVEGIFDYFAFYNLLQNQDKLVVVSTLGSRVSPETAGILKDLDILHFIVACNWDEIGRNGIERIAVKSGGWSITSADWQKVRLLMIC